MNLTLGADGEAVQELQERLAERSYDVGPVDGQFGPRTREAVAALQREQELSVDGTVGPATAEELGLDIDVTVVEEERSAFKELVMSNPNYFGNRPELDYEPVTERVGDTSYEELTCVGYDPGIGRLEAVVSVKRDHGYGGSVCEDGSTEFVRFFIDRDRTGDWEDLGVGSTRVFDVPGLHPVDHAVAVDLDPEQEPCDTPVLPRVRAVLSWEVEPPAGEEGYRPVWGNRLEADIQIEPASLSLDDLIDSGLPENILDQFDSDEPVPSEPPTLGTSQLLELYEGTSVPSHRAGFSELQELLDGPVPSGPSGPMPPEPTGPLPLPPDLPDPFPGPQPIPEPQPQPQPEPLPGFPELPPGLDIDPGDIAENLFETTGNTSYEELDCVGLRRNVLTGVLTIKRPSGFSGGLCTAGSEEYVAFWEKDVSGGTWSYLGTGSVRVHDIPGMPADGLQYAVHLPVDLSHHRKPCTEGPSLVRIRAVMAWNRKPSTSDPSFTPTWGNRVETVVRVPPGPSPRADGRLAIGSVGDVPPPLIEQRTGQDDTGTASGQSVLGSFHARQAPFGGLVTITGRPLDGLDPAPSGSGALKYRVSVRPHRPSLSDDANPWRHLTNQFQVYTYDDPGNPQDVPNDNDGYYTYVPGVVNDVLAKWFTNDDGLYELKIEAKRGGSDVTTDVISYDDGRTEDRMLIRLDNTRPEATIDITGVKPDGTGPLQPAEECDFFNVGDTVTGEFTADDRHLRRYDLYVRPDGPAGAAHVRETSSPRVVDRGGGDGEWDLKTSWDKNEDVERDAGEMADCGYTIHVRAVDNTIVSNSYSGHRARQAKGFCLLPAGATVSDGEEDSDGNGEGENDSG